MTDTTYTGVLDLAAGAFLLVAVLIVWRRDLRATVRLLAWQGAALAVLPISEGVLRHEAAPVVVGDDLEAEVAKAADELDRIYDRERLIALAKAGGKEDV